MESIEDLSLSSLNKEQLNHSENCKDLIDKDELKVLRLLRSSEFILTNLEVLTYSCFRDKIEIVEEIVRRKLLKDEELYEGIHYAYLARSFRIIKFYLTQMDKSKVLSEFFISMISVKDSELFICDYEDIKYLDGYYSDEDLVNAKAYVLDKFK